MFLVVTLFITSFSLTTADNLLDHLPSKSLCNGKPCACDLTKELGLICSCIKAGITEMDVTMYEDNQQLQSVSRIKIEDCNSLTIIGNQLEGLKSLKILEIVNISQIYVDNEAFSWKASPPKSRHDKRELGPCIYITNCTFSLLNASVFANNIHNISFNGVTFESFNSYAFAHLSGTELITFENCTFFEASNMGIKRSEVGNIRISRCIFLCELSSRTFYDVRMHGHFIIEDSTFKGIHRSAFSTTGATSFQVNRCQIERVSDSTFHSNIKGPFSMFNSTIKVLDSGVFHNLKVDKKTLATKGRQDFILKNVTIKSFERGSFALNLEMFNAKFENIYLNQECSCQDSALQWKLIQKYTGSDASKLIEFNLNDSMFCNPKQKTGKVIIEDYHKNYCDVILPQKLVFAFGWYNSVGIGFISGVLAFIIIALIVSRLKAICKARALRKRQRRELLQINEANLENAENEGISLQEIKINDKPPRYIRRHHRTLNQNACELEAILECDPETSETITTSTRVVDILNDPRFKSTDV